MTTTMPATAHYPRELGQLARPARSLWTQALGSLWRDWAAITGLALFTALVAAAIFAAQISPYGPTTVQMRERLQLPSTTHWLGTDELGRDLLSRLIWGARVSLSVGLISVGIAALCGIPLGLAGAFYGGFVDSLIMRMLDGLLAFPTIILALAIVTVLSPSLGNVMIAIGIVSIPRFARITRGSVLAQKQRDYVDAARAVGATGGYLMFRVLLPNCLSPLLVETSVSFASAILTEAALSFLGLGVLPPTPSWGAMLDTGRKYLGQTPWYSFAAGAAIFVTVLSLNLLGDGLRDALDPRLQGSAERK